MGVAAASFAISLLLRARSAENATRPSERLASCPATPNCVTSLNGGDQHGVSPLSFHDTPEAAWQRLQIVVASLPRTAVIVAKPNYLAAECSSRLFGFVDDLQFSLDREAAVIHVRSASRVGHSDLGVNRRRVERLRELLSKTG